MTSEGWYHPLIVKKFVEKKAKAINMIFASVTKIFWTTFKIIFEILSVVGAHVTIIGVVVYKNP